MASLNPGQGSPPQLRARGKPASVSLALNLTSFAGTLVTAVSLQSLRTACKLHLAFRQIYLASPLDGFLILILSVFFNLAISPKKKKSKFLALLGEKKSEDLLTLGPHFYTAKWTEAELQQIPLNRAYALQLTTIKHSVIY